MTARKATAASMLDDIHQTSSWTRTRHKIFNQPIKNGANRRNSRNHDRFQSQINNPQQHNSQTNET